VVKKWSMKKIFCAYDRPLLCNYIAVSLLSTVQLYHFTLFKTFKTAKSLKVWHKPWRPIRAPHSTLDDCLCLAGWQCASQLQAHTSDATLASDTCTQANIHHAIFNAIKINNLHNKDKQSTQSSMQQFCITRSNGSNSHKETRKTTKIIDLFR